jgi:DNA-binding IclR family transcriptional regulator
MVPAVDRALAILEYLLSKNWAVSMSELSKNLKIPKATAFRIVKTLESRGYLFNPQQKGEYILGPSAISLGSSTPEKSEIKQIANPFMFELAEKTNQTVQLGVLLEYMVIYIDQIRTSRSLNVIVPTGTPFNVNLSAGGKVLVAYLPEQQQRDFLSHAELKSNTPKSVVDKEKFYKDLLKIMKQGYSIDDEEFARGIRCIAAPIFNHEGKNIASIGITGHTSIISDEKMVKFTDITIKSAEEISKAMGYKKSNFSKSIN